MPTYKTTNGDSLEVATLSSFVIQSLKIQAEGKVKEPDQSDYEITDPNSESGVPIPATANALYIEDMASVKQARNQWFRRMAYLVAVKPEKPLNEAQLIAKYHDEIQVIRDVVLADSETESDWEICLLYVMLDTKSETELLNIILMREPVSMADVVKTLPLSGGNIEGQKP